MELSTFDLLKSSHLEGGFYLDEAQLKSLQATLLFMLKDISCLAEKHGIPVYLGSGTVLGAVRHKGFIPWDDDIDVNIERKYYAQFIAILKRERADRYWIHSPEETHNYGILSTRIRLKGSDVRLREDNYSDECGVSLDVFAIENTYNNPLLRTLQGTVCLSAGFILSCRKFYRDRKQLRPLFQSAPGKIPVYFIKSGIGFLFSWGSVDFWTHNAVRIYSACRNNKSKYVSVPVGRKHFFREMYLRETFCGKKKAMFENNMFYCTSDPDTYMKALYGEDYMQLPPLDKREKHLFFSFSIPEAILDHQTTFFSKTE